MPERSSRRQPSLTAVHAPVSRTLFTLFLIFTFIVSLMLATSTQAAPVVPVDDRVQVSFSAFDVIHKEKAFITHATVQNISTVAILDPVQIVITGIDKQKIKLTNADGFTDGNNPYVLVPLTGGMLAPGETSGLAVLRFAKVEVDHPDHDNGGGNDDFSGGKGKAKGKSKDKHNHPNAKGHPGVDFEYSVLGGSEVALSAPKSVPFALSPNSGETDVVFRVDVFTIDGATAGNILLRNLTLGNEVLMNDNGTDGDGIAGDGKYGVTVTVDTSALSAGDCMTYVSATDVDGLEVVSTIYELCATSFPVSVDPSNTEPENVILFSGAEVVADEVLIVFVKGTTEAEILKLLKEINAEVTGTVLPNNLYQVRLSSALTEDGLQKLISRLKSRKEVVAASANAIGSLNFAPDDTQYPSQHALQLVRADDIWDAGADGQGITVTVMDSGVQSTHPDFVNSDASNQIVAPSPFSGGNTYSIGHGTEMAGIIGAATDNALGVAGIAKGALINSYKVTTDATVTQAEMISGFAALAASTDTGDVVNASFSNFGLLLPAPGLCGNIDDVISGGSIVVNSAGNDNATANVWPGFCNDPAFDTLLNTQLAGDALTQKGRFIVVAASNCSSGGCAADSKKADSNYGPWIDIAAPGVGVETTTMGSAYTTSSGTSASAAIISGAAAIMKSCGLVSSQVKTRLQMGATVAVTGDFDRVNVHDALETLNNSPTGLQLDGGTAVSINENTNTTGGTSVGTLTTTDPNSCDAHTYTITGGADAANFAISGNQLELDDGSLNFEVKSSYTVNVQSTDFFGASTGSQTFTVNVTDLDEAPSISNAVRNIDENEPNGTNVGAPVTGSDEDTGHSLAYAITGGNTGGTFAINSATGQITVANSPTLDYETTPVFNLTVQVTDNSDSPPLNDSATVTINLNDVAEGGPIPAPVLVYDGTFEDYLDAFGDPYRRWNFDVTNWASYPVDWFTATSAYGPCGGNPTPARAWVDFYRASDNSRIYGFCALGDPANLNDIWFGMPEGVAPPAGGVYIVITDNATGLTYTSNVVSDAVLPFP